PPAGAASSTCHVNWTNAPATGWARPWPDRPGTRARTNWRYARTGCWPAVWSARPGPPAGAAAGGRPPGPASSPAATAPSGPHTPRWRARSGAEPLVPPGRRGADVPGAAELAAELAELGTRLTLPACDLAERDQVERLLADLDEQGSPITAVVHAAAFTGLASLDATPMEAFAGI